MDAALKQQIDQLHDSDRHEEILRVLEALPEGERDYDCVCLLARACNNLGQEERAAGLLLSVREQGETDPLWHFRLGYAYYYQGREREALPEFQRTLELDPGDPDAGMFLDWCRKAIDAKEPGGGGTVRPRPLHPGGVRRRDGPHRAAFRTGGECDDGDRLAGYPGEHRRLPAAKPTTTMCSVRWGWAPAGWIFPPIWPGRSWIGRR